MTTGAKLAAFVAVLALAFGGAAVVGAAVGPIDVGGNSDAHTEDGDGQMGSESTGGETTGGSAAAPRGLSIAQSGYRLDVPTTSLTAGTPTAFTFRIVDDTSVDVSGDSTTVTEFDELHERRLHLIVLSRDLVDHLHLHPTMAADGEWAVELPALTPGSYRVFADFQPAGGENLTLGTDLTVAGEVVTVDLPAPSEVSTIDGYTVTFAGDAVVGAPELQFTVERDGKAVQPEPYLGAAGHLVAIRAGDLAYLHVHPEGRERLAFVTEFPTAGTYRLFLEFSHEAVVRTATFTVIVGGMNAVEPSGGADHDTSGDSTTENGEH